MQHFNDPILSRIQASVESELRRQGEVSGTKNATEELAQHAHMQRVAQICTELTRARRNPLKKFGNYYKPFVAEKLNPACECMDFYCRLVLSHIYGDKDRHQALLNEFNFSGCDPKWIKAVEEWYKHFGPDTTHAPIPYINYQSLSDFVQEGLPDNLKIGLLGDWGSGSDTAISVLQGVVAHEPDLIIHLGDVYYAGTTDEFDHKFHDVLEKYAVDRNGLPIPVLNLPGNHDMYAGGGAYYNQFKRLNQRNGLAALKVEQHASYFCLRLANKSWQILAMDTTYHDHNPLTVSTGITHVRDSEQQWLLDKVRNFPGKTILMSHHQAFSPYEQIGSMSRKKPGEFFLNPNLMNTYRQLSQAAGKEIPLWIWGHEHNLAIYNPFAGINRGRCVGHSAVPVLVMHNPYATRAFKFMDVLASLAGLLKGKWGLSLHREFVKMLRLLFARQSVATPDLVTAAGKPVMLKEAADKNLYRNGFALMQFAAKEQFSDLSVEYYDNVETEPLFTEILSGRSPKTVAG